MALTLRSLETADALVEAGLVSRESAQRLQIYVALLMHWRERINLIGASTAGQVWSRHVADSLQLLAHVDAQGACLVDLGSGAGFPGLALAIAMHGRPHGFAHLIESNAKKAAFLREAIRVTGAPAQVHCVRIESVDSETLRPRPTIVTARALAPWPKLLPLALEFVQKGAQGLFLKGQDVDIELTETSKYWTIQVEKLPSRYTDGGVILKVDEVSRDARFP